MAEPKMVTEKQAIKRLTKAGWTPKEAKLATDSITGMKAALDTFMPYLGNGFTHNGWRVTRG
jgi:hypothetical protein